MWSLASDIYNPMSLVSTECSLLLVLGTSPLPDIHCSWWLAFKPIGSWLDREPPALGLFPHSCIRFWRLLCFLHVWELLWINFTVGKTSNLLSLPDRMMRTVSIRNNTSCKAIELVDNGLTEHAYALPSVWELMVCACNFRSSHGQTLPFLGFAHCLCSMG